jgi:hypothetical protein
MQISARTSAFVISVVVGLLGPSIAMASTISACAVLTGGPTPGNTVFPIDCTGETSGTLLADQVVPFSYSTTAGTNTGKIESAVYNDGGMLDFYYQIINNQSSATALARMSATEFRGFTTNAAFITDGSVLTGTSFVNGTVPPLTADSNADGSVIGFSFFPPISNEIPPGSSSQVLIISTDATRFTSGNVSIIDGGTATVSAFQPGASVPETGYVGLVVGSILMVALIFRRATTRPAGRSAIPRI